MCSHVTKAWRLFNSRPYGELSNEALVSDFTLSCLAICSSLVHLDVTQFVGLRYGMGRDKHTLLYMRGSYVLEGPRMSVRPHTEAHDTLNWFEHNVFPCMTQSSTFQKPSQFVT